ncbi:MAG: hypothetical protein JWL63_3345 [Rhodocyclales bacterium]|nr:hypothetical protein [Rhodocyclales bacterium]
MGRISGACADELDRRFSFQSYGDDTELEAVRPGADRRAVHDKRLLEEVYELIAMQGHFETRDLRLLTHNGVVTIAGSVSDRNMKALIGNFVRECPAVKIVINRMKVCAARDNAATHSVGDWQERAQEQWQRQDMAA